MSTFRVNGMLSLDGTRFASGLSRAEIAAKRFGSAVSNSIGSRLAGVFALGAITAFGKKIADTAEEIGNTAQRLGQTTDEVQILRQAAKESNVELSAMASVFEKIDQARSKALAGDQGLLARFAQLGVSAEDLRSKTAAQLFMGPIATAARGRSAEDLGPILRDVIGKSFGEMIPLLQTDFDELGRKMKEMGAIISVNDIVALKTFSDAVEFGSTALMSMLAPALTKLVFAVLDLAWKVAAGAGWIKTAGGGYIDETKLAALVAARPAFKKLYGEDSKQVKNIDAEMNRLLEKLGPGPGLQYILDKAAVGYGDVLEKGKKSMEALQARIAAEATALNNPRVPVFDVSPAAANARVAGAAPHTDALLQVGNFLAQSRGAVSRLAEEQLAVSRRQLAAIERVDQTMQKVYERLAVTDNPLGIV